MGKLIRLTNSQEEQLRLINEDVRIALDGLLGKSQSPERLRFLEINFNKLVEIVKDIDDALTEKGFNGHSAIEKLKISNGYKSKDLNTI